MGTQREIGRTSNEFVVTDSYQFVHGCTDHVLCDYDGTRDAINLAESTFAVFISNLREISFGILETASHIGLS